MLKAILFDLDDTLLDWSAFPRTGWRALETRHLRGVYDYLTGAGHSLESFESYSEAYLKNLREAWIAARTTQRSPHIGQVMQKAARALGVTADLDIDACLKAYGWGKIENTVVFPEVPDVLRKLSRSGLHLGIVTNAAHPMAIRDKELEEHGLLSFFPKCRFAGADVGYLKPHPAIFETALDCMGVTPAETVFVGDDPEADIAGAQGVGMNAVLRVKHPTPPMISGLIVPDGAINTLFELAAVLDEMFPGWNQ